MNLIIAQDNINSTVEMSKRAFDSDILVGNKEQGGPPEYDSLKWHEAMAKEGHLFQAMENNNIVGGAILFLNENGKQLYIGRIFIDPIYHRKGYGKKLMSCIEELYDNVEEILLDTPIWNTRTNSFYKALGYSVEKTEDGFVFYKKILK